MGANCDGKSAQFVDFSDSDILLITNMHNQIRDQTANGSLNNLPTASKMQKLVSIFSICCLNSFKRQFFKFCLIFHFFAIEWQTWSNELATVVSWNLVNCTSGDDWCRDTLNFTMAGENVGFTSSTNALSFQDAYTSIFNAWAAEAQNTNPNQINNFPDPAPT